jgi:hypothetical protein
LVCAFPKYITQGGGVKLGTPHRPLILFEGEKYERGRRKGGKCERKRKLLRKFKNSKNKEKKGQWEVYIGYEGKNVLSLGGCGIWFLSHEVTEKYVI